MGFSYGFSVVKLACGFLLLLAVTAIDANGFARSGDPRLRCWECKKENSPCPRMEDAVNTTCPFATEACLKFSEGSYLKVIGKKSMSLDIFGGHRSCLDRLMVDEMRQFGINTYSVEGCYRNLQFSRAMSGEAGLNGGIIEFKGDVCVCNSDNCNGSLRLHQTSVAVVAVALVSVCRFMVAG